MRHLRKAGSLWQNHPAVQGEPVHVIGGATKAAEPDAKRTIDQPVRLALILWPGMTTAVSKF